MHVPAISLFVALSRLRRLLEQTPELRSKGRRSPFKTVWLQNVEGVLTDYFGPESWQLSQFKDVHFFPQVSYRNDPESKFAAYFLQGVETAEQLKLVRSWGCRKVQGYYYSRPQAACELSLLLRMGKMLPALSVPVTAAAE